MSLKEYLKNKRKEGLERKAYKKIVKKRTTQATRKAYADESIKVAEERARAKARAPSGWAVAGKMISIGAKKVSTPIKRVSPMKRTTKKKRTTTKRRTRRVATPKQRYPMTIGDAIYGGY